MCQWQPVLRRVVGTCLHVFREIGLIYIVQTPRSRIWSSFGTIKISPHVIGWHLPLVQIQSIRCFCQLTFKSVKLQVTQQSSGSA